jgi:hypothetical protein
MEREANDERTKARSELARARRFHQRMDVIGLNAEVNDTKRAWSPAIHRSDNVAHARKNELSP